LNPLPVIMSVSVHVDSPSSLFQSVCNGEETGDSRQIFIPKFRNTLLVCSWGNWL